MTRLLDGKVAIVTGGASGIGLATVERFVAEGARVTIADIQDDLGAAVAARFGDSAQFVRTDVTVEADIEAVVAKTVEAFGRLDVMFNNAGAQGDRSKMVEFDADAFDRTISLLTRSVLLGHKYAARQFLAQGSEGSIISTTSAAGLQGGWSAPGYTAAKHAVVGIVKAAVAELGQSGIRSNAIAPGVIMTPILMKSFGVQREDAGRFVEFLAKRLDSTQPSGRVGQPEDVADVAVFLASDLSRYVSGTTIPVDGGATAITQGTFAAEVANAREEWSQLQRA